MGLQKEQSFKYLELSVHFLFAATDAQLFSSAHSLQFALYLDFLYGCEQDKSRQFSRSISVGGQ